MSVISPAQCTSKPLHMQFVLDVNDASQLGLLIIKSQYRDVACCQSHKVSAGRIEGDYPSAHSKRNFEVAFRVKTRKDILRSAQAGVCIFFTFGSSFASHQRKLLANTSVRYRTAPFRSDTERSPTFRSNFPNNDSPILSLIEPSSSVPDDLQVSWC